MKIVSAEYLDTGGIIKAVVRTDKRGYCAKIKINENEIADSFNDEEPYDLKSHVFYIPKHIISGISGYDFLVKKRKKSKKYKTIKIDYKPVFSDKQELLKKYDSRLTRKSAESEIVSPGVIYTHRLFEDKEGKPVNVFTLEVDTKLASLYVGTPGDGYESINVKAKVPEMIEAAVKNGVPAVAAVNADFFDMFGDCHPSGLCVKNSRVIANPDSKRPFIAIKKDGSPVITDITESPDIINELDQAASGLELIVKDGMINDFGPLEPFSYVRHPRTAAGVRPDGTVILLVADGRIPEYSNGATLVDLALLMTESGVDRAINLDGGGSSIVYTRNGDEFVLRNVPADLFRPRAKLIRKEFNCLIVTSDAQSRT
ncbi:MAG: phosphodiester glycosidase family protein [Clostridia bacterium]|nr:phosphodiester glycosidase family protein [Clostridia bacterium]